MSEGFTKEQWAEIARRDKKLNPLPACVDLPRWTQRISTAIDREFVARTRRAWRGEDVVNTENGWAGYGPSMAMED